MMNKWHLISSLIFMSCFIATRFMTGRVAEFFVLMAILFFLPAALHFFEKEGKKHKPERLIGFLMKAFPLAALCATTAFIYHSAWFASGWLLYTMLLALFGFCRLLKRGIFPLHELMIDGAWMYLALGGLWFWLYTADIQVMTFSPIIVLLTAIHFHYSAFFIPLFYGLLGRQQAKETALYKAAGWVILLSPVMIAVGISFSRLFDTFSVILYVMALYIYGILCMKTRFRSTLAKGLVVFSSLVLMGTIVLSLLYSAGMLMRVTYIIQLTAILKPFNEKEDFLLKSACPKGSTGDEGLYLHTPFITMKLPMEESFHMKPETDQSLTAVHQMKLFSIPFLTIHYHIDSESHHVSQ